MKRNFIYISLIRSVPVYSLFITVQWDKTVTVRVIVTLRLIRVTIVAVEKPYISNIKRMCSFNCLA